MPLIVTPIPSFKEQGLEEGKNCYYMPFDMIDTKVERLKKIPTYEGYLREDHWKDILIKGKSKYKEELKMKYKVRALDTYEKNDISDGELGYTPKAGEEWIVTKERADVLLGDNANNLKFVEVVTKILDDSDYEMKIEKPIEVKPEAKKPVTKKTTTKKKSKK